MNKRLLAEVHSAGSIRSAGRRIMNVHVNWAVQEGGPRGFPANTHQSTHNSLSQRFSSTMDSIIAI